MHITQLKYDRALYTQLLVKIPNSQVIMCHGSHLTYQVVIRMQIWRVRVHNLTPGDQLQKTHLFLQSDHERTLHAIGQEIF